MRSLADLRAAGVAGRTVLVRSDLNVALDGHRITDDGRPAPPGRVSPRLPGYTGTLVTAEADVLARLTERVARPVAGARGGPNC